MKKSFTLIVLSILTLAIWAQGPNKFSYQAVVRDADNNLVTEQAVGMQISILQSSAAGTAVYVETHTPTSNANGLVTVEIGGGATSDDFSAIDWSAGPYFIKTEIDPSGSTDYTITGTSQLLSVPYAKYADKAGNVFSGDYSDLSGNPTNVSDFTNDAGYLTEVTGSETGFDGWDKDASDDFSGDYEDLTNKPTMPGIAHAYAEPYNSFRSIASGINSLDSIQIDAPAAGYIYVTASFTALISHTSGTEDEAYFQIADIRDNINYYFSGFGQLRVPSALPTATSTSTSYSYPVTLTRVFKVDAAGTNTFYLNARFFSGLDSNDRFFDLNFTAIFIPTAYGDVDQ